MSSIAAVDIGSTKVVTVIADLEHPGSPRVVGVGVAPCGGTKRGVVVDIEETAQAVVSSVRKAEHMANRKLGSATVSVAGEHLHSQPSRGLVPILNPSRAITREDVHRVINHSKQIAIQGDRELILSVPRSFKIDGRDGITKPFEMSGERLEVNTLLITGLSSQLENLQRCIGRAQIDVEQMIPRALATGLAVTDAAEREQGVAVLDIGGGATDVAVYIDGSPIHLAMLSVGSQHITSDIQYLLKTTTDEAERIKVDAGACSPEGFGEDDVVEVEQIGNSQARPFSKRVLAEIIGSRVREIFRMASEEIDSAVDPKKLGAGWVVTGGGSKLQGLAEFVETAAGIKVRTAAPKPFVGMGDMLAGPEFATGVGLIKFGLKAQQDESVTAEAGDSRKLVRSIGSIFASKPKEEEI
ncbi:MAG: cell division protein FtsA [Armatimonadetes bacterium]|nr:cell division protein FtsA [Armatimonadota bacterium]